MESRKVLRVDSRTLAVSASIVILSLALSLVLSLAVFVGEARANGDCQPPSCRDDGGGGGEPPIPPPPPPPDPDPGGGGDPGGNPPPGPPVDPGEDDEDLSGGIYQDYTCGVIALCPERTDYTIYIPPGHSWAVLVSFSCRTHESCTGTPGEEEETDLPCEPTIGENGIELECDGDGANGFEWGYDIQVWAGIPPHRVSRHPFPRGLVTLPNEFDLYPEPWISEAGGPHFREDGFYSDRVNIPHPIQEDPEPGDIKEYEIGVRWRRVGDEYPQFGYVPPHCFDFDERHWNVERGDAPAACATPELDGHVRVAHAYETSSWDKPGDDNGASWDNPANGPRVDLENQVVPDVWDLVSYQVQVATYWLPEWRDRWYQWEVTGDIE